MSARSPEDRKRAAGAASPAPPEAGTSPPNAAPEAAAQPCPICGKPRQAKFAPFCSKRCADLDLSRSLKGVYAVPAVESEEDGLSDEGDSGGE